MWLYEQLFNHLKEYLSVIMFLFVWDCGNNFHASIRFVNIHIIFIY